MPSSREVELLARLEQADDVHDHARRAVAALQRVAILEGLLDRMQRAVLGGERLDGADLVAGGLHREGQARAAGLAVDQHRAGAADAVLAADMGAGEAELVAEEIGEEHANADVALDLLAVDRERDARPSDRLRPAGRQALIARAAFIVSVLFVARCAAVSTIRRTRVATTRRR